MARQPKTSSAPQTPEFTVHDRCLKARRDAGLTQEELAKRIDISPRTVTRYETGAVKPRTLVLKQWALACGVDYHWLRYENPQSPGGDSAADGTITSNWLHSGPDQDKQSGADRHQRVAA